MPILRELGPTILGIALLAAVATGVLALYRVPRRFAPLLAILRGAAQLAVISVILAGVITDPRWVALALLVMFAVAASTATQRVGWSAEHATMMAVAMATGILVTLTIVFTTGAIQFSARYALAIGGIVIGNSMSIATLAGRRFTEGVRDHWEEVEGWLALGATATEAVHEQGRLASARALVPALDQTRNVGLVVLPGAYVGLLLGGAVPGHALRHGAVPDRDGSGTLCLHHKSREAGGRR